MQRNRWHIVCHNEDCPAGGGHGGAEGYWESVLSDRVDEAPGFCPTCGEPTDEVGAVDEEDRPR